MIICGTGHRPPKLGGYTDEAFDKLVEFAEDTFIKHFRMMSVLSKPITYIGGLALGWDQASMLAADHLGLRVIGYAPCTNMDNKWPQWSKDKYQQVLNICEEVKYIHDGDYPGPWCCILRDEAMVDDSQKVLALYDGGGKGGTYQTVKYAEKRNKSIINVWNEWLEYNE